MKLYISRTTKDFLQKWNNVNSESVREGLLKNHLIKTYLNSEMRDFLEEFTSQFEGNEKVRILKLCRKTIAQNPERIMEVDQEHYKAFKIDYDMAINNDIQLDGVGWIDEELNYIDAVIELKTENEKGIDRIETAKPKANTVTPASSAPESPMTKEQTLIYFKISPSTFDRWRKNGFPCDKVGKKFFTDRKNAEAWIGTHKPKKIEFDRRGTNH